MYDVKELKKWTTKVTVNGCNRTYSSTVHLFACLSIQSKIEDYMVCTMVRNVLFVAE